MTWRMNHANYIATHTININTYISENTTIIEDMLFDDSGTKLLIAPTGSGKTHSIIETLKNMSDYLECTDTKVCIVVPNSLQVAQIESNYNVMGAYGDDRIADQVYSNNQISCYTWNKFGQISNISPNTIVILDEVHQTVQDMYRKVDIDNMMHNVNVCDVRVDITATPSKLNFRIYDTIVEYVQLVQTNYKVNLYSNYNVKLIRKIIKDSNKCAILENNIDKLESYAKLSDKSSVINGSNKHLSSTYSNIILNESISDVDLLCNTSVLVAGVNIYEPNMTDIIICNVKDASTIKQYVSRFRGLSYVNVHVFNTYATYSKIVDVEKAILCEITALNGIVSHYNNTNDDLMVRPNLFNASKELGLSCINGTYSVDELFIRNTMYTNYNNKASIGSFNYLLEEYFNDISILCVDKLLSDKILDSDLDERKVEKEELLSLIKSNVNNLIGLDEIMNDKCTPDFRTYLELSKTNVRSYKEFIIQNNLDELMNDHKAVKLIKKISKLVLKGNMTPSLAYKVSTMDNATLSKFHSMKELIAMDLVRDSRNNKNVNITIGGIDFEIYKMIMKKIKVGGLYTFSDMDKLSNQINKELGIKGSTKKLITRISNIFDFKKDRVSVKGKRVMSYKITSKHDINTFMDVFELTENDGIKLLFGKSIVKYIDKK